MPRETIQREELSTPIGYYDVDDGHVKTTRREYSEYARRVPDFVGTIRPSIVLASSRGTVLVPVDFLDNTVSRRSVA